MTIRRFAAALFGFALLIDAVSARGASSESLPSRRKALEKLFAEQSEYTLSRSPEFASIRGDRRWNDKVSDLSPRAIEEDETRTRRFVARLAAIDPTGLPEQEALTRTLLRRRLEENLENVRLAGWKMPVNPVSGIHLQALEIVPLLPFQTVKDYEDYISRLRQLPRQFEDTITAMRQGMSEHLMPPKYLLERVADQAEGVANHAPEKTEFAEPLTRMEPHLSPAEQERIRESLLAVIRDSVLPAYRRFAQFVRHDYAPRGRAEPGLWSLPDGPSRYAAAVKRLTTTRLTPDEIHQLGQAQVAQLEAQVASIAKKLGFPDAPSLQVAVEKDGRLRPRSPQDILDRYRNFIVGMGRVLPSLFDKRPRAGLEVASVPASRQGQAPAAEYRPGTKDGSRPARLSINTASPEYRSTISIETTAYHEGVPGHHMETGIARELPDLPPIRRESRYAAFSEGWAIYAERLAKDVGFFTDPYSDYGRVREELRRSSRVVADTGLHLKKWSRAQTVAYLRERGGLAEGDAQNETDQMICLPAQALVQEIGALKILQLRERARTELGAQFRLARFHDAVLAAGSIPLDLLEERIDRWIAQEKASRK